MSFKPKHEASKELNTKPLRGLERREKVSDLEPNNEIKRIELVVLRKYPRRILNTDSYKGPVAAGCGRDETGIVGIVFWGKQVDKVKVGDIIRIESGWCKRRDGEIIVSSGKYGHLSVI